MHHALGVDDHLDTVVGQSEEEVCLDDLERLVGQRRAVDRDLAPHAPGRVLQGVGERGILQLPAAPLTKGSARRRDDESSHLPRWTAGDALEYRAVLAVDRNQLSSTALRRRS